MDDGDWVLALVIIIMWPVILVAMLGGAVLMILSEIVSRVHAAIWDRDGGSAA